MTHTPMTRWIEAADERLVRQEAGCAHLRVTETQHLHLGAVIAKLPSWVWNGGARECLTHMGGHAIAYARHPLRAIRH